MAFIEELKQRKVVRVAVAYLVVAWLGVQVASIALPAFEAPSWVLRVLILVLALGFPLALMLTWAVDLTPEGPRYTPGGTGFKRMTVISVALGALALAWYFLGQPAWRDAATDASLLAADKPVAAAAAPVEASTGTRSIAVLPFVNMSGDPANEYFSDGLAETTLDMLAQVHDLKVIARTSSFAFKGKNSDVREIGRALDAAHLLEGSVQQAGAMVRITAQLIRAEDGTHLWSGKYDRKLTDVFAIQDEIAGEVVKALQLALPAAEKERLTGKRTDNVAAYQEYLRGTALLPGRRVPDMRRALQHFERAIELDPGYAGAYAAAGLALSLIDTYAGSLAPEQRAKAARYVDEALRLNPALGEAYAVRAGQQERSGELAEAQVNYARSIELAPSFATAYQWYAEFLQNTMGDLEKALPLFRRALELDPLSPVIRNEFSFAQAVNGRLDEALATNAQLLRERPDFATGFATRAIFLESRGDLVGALQAWKAQLASDPAAFARQRGRCATLVRFGAMDAARACATSVGAKAGAQTALGMRLGLLQAEGRFEEAWALARQREQSEPWEMLQLQLATGRADEALALLQKLMPEMFIQPVPTLSSNFPGDAVIGGMALVASGATEQGRDLLRRALARNATRRHTDLIYGRGWTDVLAWAVLGEPDRACAALREATAAGYFLDLSMIDHAPQLAAVRSQPCYEAALAPARARGAAQVEAARKAGLL